MCIVTRNPPSTPCATTSRNASTPSHFIHFRESLSQSQTARIVVNKPAAEASSRCVCSKNAPPLQNLIGSANML